MVNQSKIKESKSEGMKLGKQGKSSNVWGILSLVLGVVAIGITVYTLFWIKRINDLNPGSIEIVLTMFIASVIVGAIVVIGIGLGIIGLLKKRGWFPAMGIVANLIGALMFYFLYIFA